MILSRKLHEGTVVMMDSVRFAEPKTKLAATIFKNLRAHEQFSNLGTTSTLLATPHDKNIIRATRNLPKVSYIEPRNLNTTALLHHRYVVLDTSGVKELERIL